MLEREVEIYFVERIKAAGGIAEKTISPSGRGYFDRVAVLPGNRVIFAELKKPKGGKVSMHQRQRHDVYRKLGCEVQLIKSKADVDRLIDHGPSAGVKRVDI